MKITRKARARALRDRVCATCTAKLSGSETGSGYVECITCRIERRRQAQSVSAVDEPRPRA